MTLYTEQQLHYTDVCVCVRARACAHYELSLMTSLTIHSTKCLNCSSILPSREDVDTSPLAGCHFMGLPVKKKALRNYRLQSNPQRVWHSRKRLKRMQALASAAPSEEGIQCHDATATKTNTEGWDEAKKMLDASLGATDINKMLHETARMFQVAIENQKSLTRGPWFTKAWLGIDHNAWIKAVAYQAAVHALIEAALDIARRQEDKNFIASSFMQKSLLLLRNPLEVSIRQHLSARDPAAEAWIWSQQHPVAVSSLMSTLKRGACVAAAATIDSHEPSQTPNKDLDSTLFMLSLSTFASIMKLGLRKLSCPAFSLSLAEETGHLMDALVECSSINNAYQFISSIGLTNEFLRHFSLRAALHSGDPKVVRNERLFWIALIQNSLRGSLAREGLHPKLSSSSQCVILKHNLAVFGFFAALGRRARSFLASKKVHLDDHLLNLFRYLEGGNLTVYSELATLSTYQLFVEVATEELDWIPFFDNNGFGNTKSTVHGVSDVKQLPSNEETAEAIAVVLNVCSCWVDDFMLYNDRLQQAQTVVTTKFLSNVQSILCDCIAATSRRYRQSDLNKNFMTGAASELEQVLSYEDSIHKAFRDKAKKALENLKWEGVSKGPQTAKSILPNIDLLQVQDQLKAFDEGLQTVEIFLLRLEGLLKEFDLSRLQNGSVHLTAIKINLQKIRRLKREAQALERSLKLKASIKEQHLSNQLKLQPRYGEQENQFCNAPSHEKQNNRGSTMDSDETLPQQRIRTHNASKNDTAITEDLPKDFLSSSFVEAVAWTEAALANVDKTYQTAPVVSSIEVHLSEEVVQLNTLQCQLYQLDYRIRESVGVTLINDTDGTNMSSEEDKAVINENKAWDFLSKSTKKLKDASMDVLKGTQLLVTDVDVAITLIKRRVAGHNFTERERRLLHRTCTDLASVIPIGFLMLLPVTAVGHAAMLAAIQKYVPALIPSAYAPERLDLLKQLEHLREMDENVPGYLKLPPEERGI